MTKIKLDFNPEVSEILTKNNVPVDDGKVFLLCKYLNLKPSYFPEALENKISSLGFYTIDYTKNKITWKIDLFGESAEGFEWVKEYIEMFAKRNSLRRNSLNTVLPKIKKLLLNNPSIGSRDILEATKIYLNETDPKFIMESQYFISKNNVSKILDYIERLPKDTNGRTLETSTYKDNEDFI